MNQKTYNNVSIDPKNSELFYKFMDPSTNELLNVYFKIKSEKIMLELYFHYLENEFKINFSKKFWDGIDLLYSQYMTSPESWEYDFKERNGDFLYINIPTQSSWQLGDDEVIAIRVIIYKLMCTVWCDEYMSESSEWYY